MKCFCCISIIVEYVLYFADKVNLLKESFNIMMIYIAGTGSELQIMNDVIGVCSNPSFGFMSYGPQQLGMG